MPGKPNREWDYFRIKSVPKDSGVRIEECVHKGRSQDLTVYRISYLCCGDEMEMTHTTIRKRQKRPPTSKRACRSCGQKTRIVKTAKRKIPFTPKRVQFISATDAMGKHIGGFHGWYIPAGVAKGPWLWSDANARP